MNDFNSRVVSATKWSAITEFLSKLITPILGLVLARLLTPEAFGVVATFTMIISLADIFADAGFQKYIVQHEFRDEENLANNATVAFWSNQTLAFFIWFIITIFRDSLAEMVGSPGCGMALSVACFSIPLIGFSSIQTAIFKRNLNFKALFRVGVISSIVPLLVTIPLAVILRNYWALVIGTLAKNIINVIVLIYISDWKPSFFYSFRLLKEMLSFSMWSMIETFSIWLNQYVDVFFVGTLLTQYYLGLYKTSITIIGQVLGIVTAIVTPVIFSSLSRLQNDDASFKHLFYRFQNIVAIIVLPLGAIIYSYSDVITFLVLGEQWLEASFFIGIWAASSSFSIATTRYCSEIYRAKGRPKLCFLSQILHLVVLAPGVYYSIQWGFVSLCYFRAFVVLELVFVNFVISSYCFKITAVEILKNITEPLLYSLLLVAISFVLKSMNDHYILQMVYILISLGLYSLLILKTEENRLLVKHYLLRK